MTEKVTSPPHSGGGRWGAITGVALLVFGMVLALISLLLPPPGEINDSVLYIFAQILIYAGSVFGIGEYLASLPALPRRERAGRRTEEVEKEESPPQK